MKISRKKLTAAVLGALMAFGVGTSFENASAAETVPRTIVTTDGEIDDMDSFLRYLLYTNELETEGFVYSSSMWHYKGDGKGTKMISDMKMTRDLYGARSELRWCGETWIQEYIEKYREVYPNLLKHDSRYPDPDYLQSIVKVGNIDFEGEMSYDTEGSDWIKKVLLDSDPRPVYIQVWGGTNTIARVLKSIEDEYKDTADWDNIYKKVCAKTIIYAILDQDITLKKYIEPNWPDIGIIYNSKQFGSFCPGYLGKDRLPKELRQEFEGSWVKKNIIKGPLLSGYMTWGDGHKLAGDPEDVFGDIEVAKKKGFNKYDVISEGDSPSFLFLLDTGLRSRENLANGGWGGRFVQSKTKPNRYEDGEDVTDYNPYTGQNDTIYPQMRWITEIQNDFAARVDWTIKDYAEANHAPTANVTEGTDIAAAPGETLTLTGSGTDPDGDSLSYSWQYYKEIGTYPNDIKLGEADKNVLKFTVPTDAKTGEQIHLILTVKDAGTPPLTHHAHVIVTVK